MLKAESESHHATRHWAGMLQRSNLNDLEMIASTHRFLLHNLPGSGPALSEPRSVTTSERPSHGA